MGPAKTWTTLRGTIKRAAVYSKPKHTWNGYADLWSPIASNTCVRADINNGSYLRLV